MRMILKKVNHLRRNVGQQKTEIENAKRTISEAETKRREFSKSILKAEKDLKKKEDEFRAKLTNVPIEIPRNMRRNPLEKIMIFLEKVLQTGELLFSFRKLLTEINVLKQDIRRFKNNISDEEKTISKYENIKKAAEDAEKKYCN